jgi:hypothetical protein
MRPLGSSSDNAVSQPGAQADPEVMPPDAGAADPSAVSSPLSPGGAFFPDPGGDKRLAVRLRHWVRYCAASELRRILAQAADRLDEVAAATQQPK